MLEQSVSSSSSGPEHLQTLIPQSEYLMALQIFVSDTRKLEQTTPILVYRIGIFAADEMNIYSLQVIYLEVYALEPKLAYFELDVQFT